MDREWCVDKQAEREELWLCSQELTPSWSVMDLQPSLLESLVPVNALGAVRDLKHSLIPPGSHTRSMSVPARKGPCIGATLDRSCNCNTVDSLMGEVRYGTNQEGPARNEPASPG